MRNSGGRLTFDLSHVIELLSFEELYNKFIIKIENWASSKSCTAQKMKFSSEDFFSKCAVCGGLVTFTEEILNGKLYFLCRDG